MEDEQSTSPSLKSKLKQSLCISCCFSNNGGREILDADDCPRLPEIKKKCRNLVNQMIARHYHRRRCSSADFKYDPLSYALNFDDGGFNDDECLTAPLRDFSSTLPASLPLKTVTKVGIPCL